MDLKDLRAKEWRYAIFSNHILEDIFQQARTASATSIRGLAREAGYMTTKKRRSLDNGGINSLPRQLPCAPKAGNTAADYGHVVMHLF